MEVEWRWSEISNESANEKAIKSEIKVERRWNESEIKVERKSRDDPLSSS